MLKTYRKLQISLLVGMELGFEGPTVPSGASCRLVIVNSLPVGLYAVGLGVKVWRWKYSTIQDVSGQGIIRSNEESDFFCLSVSTIGTNDYAGLRIAVKEKIDQRNHGYSNSGLGQPICRYGWWNEERQKGRFPYLMWFYSENRTSTRWWSKWIHPALDFENRGSSCQKRQNRTSQAHIAILGEHHALTSPGIPIAIEYKTVLLFVQKHSNWLISTDPKQYVTAQPLF